MKNIAIIGYGRFGQCIAELLDTPDHTITIVSGRTLDGLPSTYTQRGREDAFLYCDTFVYTCAIRDFSATIQHHAPWYNQTTQSKTIIDCLSIKIHPQQVCQTYISSDIHTVIHSHPMRGPDSIRSNGGVAGLPTVIWSSDMTSDRRSSAYNRCLGLQMQTVILSPQEHDRAAATGQGLAHCIGRMLEVCNINPSPIDTYGAKLLHDLRTQTCNDSINLFYDLQNYNPYTSTMRKMLDNAHQQIDRTLVSDKLACITPQIYGIQGGPGSFNEQTLLTYLQEKNITDYTIEYLYTTAKVLEHIVSGDIHVGLFAIHNRAGLFVDESLDAMSQHIFTIHERRNTLIAHHLMKRSDTAINQISHIMAHPQVFLQCQDTMHRDYPTRIQESGSDDYIDTARAAQALANGEIAAHYAICGPRLLADMYGFDVIQSDMQDSNDNITTFLLVGK